MDRDLTMCVLPRTLLWIINDIWNTAHLVFMSSFKICVPSVRYAVALKAYEVEQSLILDTGVSCNDNLPNNIKVCVSFRNRNYASEMTLNRLLHFKFMAVLNCCML